MTSLRPSTLATPSPISRTMPTFDFDTEVLRAAISDSSSWRILLMTWRQVNRFSRCWSVIKLVGEALEPVFHAPVPHVAADADFHPPEKFRMHRELGRDLGAVFLPQIRDEARL